MIVFRKRLIIWLIRAYIRKRKKVILFSFLGGLLVFLTVLLSSRFIFSMIPPEKKVIVGLVGALSPDSLPTSVLSKISSGLTVINDDGSVSKGAAGSWEITDGGRRYTFHLRKDLAFHDGSRVTSHLINYSFKDVSVKRPDNETLIFQLKEPYAPFLVTTSRPIFKKGLVGFGEYEMDDIKLNGSFVKYLRTKSKKNIFKVEEYIFYPSVESLKIAFALGEVTKAYGLSDTKFRAVTFSAYPKVQIDKRVQFSKLVTLFYNTQDPLLSDKKIRSGLSYALPDAFSEGERAHSSYVPFSIYYDHDLVPRSQDIEHAVTLVEPAFGVNKDIRPKLTISTLSKYRIIAAKVVNAWKKLGFAVAVEEVDQVPARFQIFLGDFNVPKDPDQYPLWHSTHENNITRLNSKRIDKLLEDGRKAVKFEDRQQIYEDFQKYLLDESPASFLYFPYEYDVKRK